MYYPFTGEPPVLPEINLLNYVITNSSLTLTIKNSGKDNATGITLLVDMQSIPLIIYNNSLLPFDLDVDETEVIVIDLTSFYDNFTWGDNYTIKVNIDPNNQIVEENELNNEIDLDYQHRPDLSLPDLIVNNYLLTEDALWVYVNNTGNDNATSVLIYAEIGSLKLPLYNNSLSPLDIDINEVFEVYINLSDYKLLFTAGETYEIDFMIDPGDTISELNELNNQLILEYKYNLSGAIPDLLIQNDLLFNNSLIFTVKNNGTSDANLVEIIVQIDSIPLIIYNNSFNPVNLSIDGTFQINIALLDLENDFINDTIYHIRIWIDFYDNIPEFDETNNNLSLFYHYVVYEQPPPYIPPSVPWTTEFLIVISFVTILSLALKFRKYKFLK